MASPGKHSQYKEAGDLQDFSGSFTLIGISIHQGGKNKFPSQKS